MMKRRLLSKTKVPIIIKAFENEGLFDIKTHISINDYNN